MTDIDLINQEINTLEELACEIERQVIDLLKETPLTYRPDPPGVISCLPDHKWTTLPDTLKQTQRSAIRSYQKYFSTGLHFIKDFLPEREEEFIDCYEAKQYRNTAGIMDYLQFRRNQNTNKKNDIVNQFISRFEIQRSILLAVPFVAKIKEKNLREIISADFIESEIEQSEYLFRIGCYRAAGVLY
jgi:hypothetical protein